jgi:hypothetical protein
MAYVAMACYVNVTSGGLVKIADCKHVEMVAFMELAQILVNVSARKDIVVKVAK